MVIIYLLILEDLLVETNRTFFSPEQFMNDYREFSFWYLNSDFIVDKTHRVKRAAASDLTPLREKDRSE